MVELTFVLHKSGEEVFLIHLSDLGLISPKEIPLSVRMRHPGKNCQEKTAAATDSVAYNKAKTLPEPVITAFRKDLKSQVRLRLNIRFAGRRKSWWNESIPA
jgi:hypothetical protein